MYAVRAPCARDDPGKYCNHAYYCNEPVPHVMGAGESTGTWNLSPVFQRHGHRQPVTFCDSKLCWHGNCRCPAT